MVAVIITVVICVAVLLAALILNSTDYIKARVDAKIAIMKQKQIEENTAHDRWKEMLELESKLNTPELPVSDEIQLAQIELAKAQAEARTTEAQAKLAETRRYR